MPTDTPNQGLTMPVQADTAVQATAFLNYTTDVEPRLVQRYTNEADRTTRNPTPTDGEVSTYPGYLDLRRGGAWWEVLPLYARKAAETQNVNANTTLVNDSHLFVPLRANARYFFMCPILYDSGTTADIKLTFTGPAGFTLEGLEGPRLDSAVAAAAGNTQYGIGVPLVAGGAGIGTFLSLTMFGSMLTAGTAGNLQLQWAQNASEAVATRVKTNSQLIAWRVG